MNGREFFDLVNSHDDLEIIKLVQGATPKDDRVLIQMKRGIVTEFPLSEIIAHEWHELLAIMTGTREPKVMTHITRIVGYFSQVNNWNRSKIAELKDRHKGDYGVSEPAEARESAVA